MNPLSSLISALPIVWSVVSGCNEESSGWIELSTHLIDARSRHPVPFTNARWSQPVGSAQRRRLGRGRGHFYRSSWSTSQTRLVRGGLIYICVHTTGETRANTTTLFLAVCLPPFFSRDQNRSWSILSDHLIALGELATVDRPRVFVLGTMLDAFDEEDGGRERIDAEFRRHVDTVLDALDALSLRGNATKPGT